MYRIIRIFALLLVFIDTNAHVNYCPQEKKGNIVVSYCTGFKDYEFPNHVETLSTLANHLLNNYNLDTVYPIRINFSHTQIDSSHKTICIDSVDLSYYIDSELYPQGKITDIQTGIYISIKGKTINSSSVLKLLDYAVKNQNSIKQNQKLHQFNTIFGNENRLTIDKEEIREILITDNDDVTKILNTKIHRKPDSLLQKHELSYYYQNDTYHFYFNEENWKSEKTIFTTKSLKQIITIDLNYSCSHTNKYYLIFENDSTFYRCSKNARHTYKRVIAPNQFNHAPLISKKIFYNRRNNSVSYNYDQYTGDHIDYSNKILFFTDIDTVIANYGSLEEIFIHNLNRTVITDSTHLKSYNKKTDSLNKCHKDSLELKILYALLITTLSTILIIFIKSRKI